MPPSKSFPCNVKKEQFQNLALINLGVAESFNTMWSPNYFLFLLGIQLTYILHLSWVCIVFSTWPPTPLIDWLVQRIQQVVPGAQRILRSQVVTQPLSKGAWIPESPFGGSHPEEPLDQEHIRWVFCERETKHWDLGMFGTKVSDSSPV